jgi:CHRD domain-containing protein
VKQRLILGGMIAAVFAAGVYAAEQAPGSGTSRMHADLLGFQEDPSVSTTGNGSFTAKIDDEAQVIEYELSYADLEGGNTLFAHIHLGSHDHNGGVSAFLCGGSTKPAPCPNVGGTVTGTIVPADIVGPNAQGIEPGSWVELVRAIRAGHTYANVHTTRWPGGEIRGQINNNSQREATR